MASLFLELFKYFMMGVASFFILPLLAAALPWEYAKKIVQPYQSIAMGLLGRGLMIQRSHGGITLKKSRHDGRIPAERVSSGKHHLYFQDPAGYMSTFRGYPFGLAHEDRAAIVDARTTHCARLFKQMRERGEDESPNGLRAYFPIENGTPTLVDLKDAKAGIQGNAPPSVVDRVETFIEKSQLGFNSSRIYQDMPFIMAALAGFGVMWFAKEVGAGGSVDTSSVVPIILGVPI